MLQEISQVMGKPNYKQEVREIYRRFGYSESYIASGQIKESKTWNEIMDIYLPDNELALHHKELLNAVKIGHYVFPAKESDETIKETIESYGLQCVRITLQRPFKRAYFSIPNMDAKRHALDMAYKLKKKYGEIVVTHKFRELSDTDIEGEIAGLLSEAIRLTEGEAKESGEQPS